MINHENNSEFIASTQVINWDDHKGLALKTDEESEKQYYVMSAAMGLAHEMGHASQYLDGDIDRYNRTNQPITLTEAANLRNCETPIAKQLGEPIRKKYTDTYDMPIRMTSSTHYKTMHYYRWPPSKWRKKYPKEYNLDLKYLIP